MTFTLLEKLGDWNPQFMREVRGRFKSRNASIVAVSSLVSQALLLLVCSTQTCHEYNGNRCADLSWEFHWLTIFRTLNWLLPLLLFSIGVYMLLADWVREQRRGTLNFIRLSPQPSQTILLGKILGVPIIVYLGLALAVPLHWLAGFLAGVPLAWTISFYALIAAVCALFYSTVLLNAGLTQAPYQALAGSFLGLWLGSSFVGFIELNFDWNTLTYRELGDWHWFFWNLGREPWQLTLWTFITICVGAYWIWQAANRMFRNPNGTMLSKYQSYWLVGSFQIWLLGLFLPQLNQTWANQPQLFGYLFAISLITLFLLLGVMWGISPQRQALLDWARYEKVNIQRLSWRNLMGGEKSPAPVAIAVNLAITAVIWLPCLLLLPMSTDVKIKALANLLLSANLIGFYAVVVQLMLLTMRKKPGIWAGSSLSVALFLPLIILSALQAKFTEGVIFSGLWLVSVFGAPWVVLEQVSIITVFFSLLAQWAILAGLSFQLTRQLQRAGESASKSLFANRPVLPN